VTQSDANLFKDFLRYRSRSGMYVNIVSDMTRLQGADAFNRVLLYTPNPFIAGSSVSHWDTSAFRNLLMEPNFNGDLTHSVTAPFDVTLEALHDIGW
jgi:hypothetical protein